MSVYSNDPHMETQVARKLGRDIIKEYEFEEGAYEESAKWSLVKILKYCREKLEECDAALLTTSGDTCVLEDTLQRMTEALEERGIKCREVGTSEGHKFVVDLPGDNETEGG